MLIYGYKSYSRYCFEKILRNISFSLSVVTFGVLFTGCGNNELLSKIQVVLNKYESSWEEKNFAGMYELLSTESKSYISQEDFLKKYETIYNDINADNIEITITRASEDESDEALSKEDKMVLKYILKKLMNQQLH